jgi:hypothetical protein
MELLNQKFRNLAAKITGGGQVHIAIFGLGSVGHYLLDYLLGLRDPSLKFCVVGRNQEKLARDVNISLVAGLIRGPVVNEIETIAADFTSPDSLEAAMVRARPDILVNSSRAYSGLKYGGISWQRIRAYGIWAPLSIKHVKSIMRAQRRSAPGAIVINTSYPDASNAWLKTAGLAYPDLGSGNLNHLVPRIKMACAALLGLTRPEEKGTIEVTLATSHFHDVVISKEGLTEGVDPLLEVKLAGCPVALDYAEIYRRCALPMPSDQKRNMMNASSNFEIIARLLAAARHGTGGKLHVPGLDGMLGGYPCIVEAAGVRVLESPFTLARMAQHNRQSLGLDGIEDISSGRLIFTDELVRRVKAAFAFDLPREVALDESDQVAERLVQGVIAPNT